MTPQQREALRRGPGQDSRRQDRQVPSAAAVGVPASGAEPVRRLRGCPAPLLPHGGADQRTGGRQGPGRATPDAQPGPHQAQTHAEHARRGMVQSRSVKSSPSLGKGGSVTLPMLQGA
jgi:hypothetical protein